jgi:hypothetical protein
VSQPALNSKEALADLKTQPVYLTPCSTQGKLLSYVDGFDQMHQILTAEERTQVHDWVQKLGAPTP